MQPTSLDKWCTEAKVKLYQLILINKNIPKETHPECAYFNKEHLLFILKLEDFSLTNFSIDAKIKIFEFALEIKSLEALSILNDYGSIYVLKNYGHYVLTYTAINYKKNTVFIKDAPIKEENGNENLSTPKSKVILKHTNEFSEYYEDHKADEDIYNKDLNGYENDIDYRTENIETKIIKYLLNKSISDIEKEIDFDTIKKKLVLHKSVEHGNLKFLLLFYEWLAEKIEEKHSEKNSDIINDLLNENFTKFINFNKETKTNSLIFTACKFGRFKILQALKKLISYENFLSILNEKEKDENNSTILHLACLNGDTETIRFIFSENLVDLKNELNKKGQYPIDCFLENINSASYYDEEILDIVKKLSVYENDIEKKRIPTYLQKCFKMNLYTIFNTIYKQLKTEFEMKIDNNSSLNKAFNHISLSVLNEILQAINSNNNFDDYEKNDFRNFFEILLDHALFFLEDQHEIGNGTLRNFLKFLFCRSLPLELAFSRENHILAEKILLLGIDFKVIEENYFNVIINCIKNDNSQLIVQVLQNLKIKNFKEENEFKFVYNCAKYNSIQCFEIIFLSSPHPKLLSYLFKEDSNDGLIPLNVAIKNNNLEMIKIINNYVKNAGCIKQMLKKQNAAHFAAEYATNNIIELILTLKPFLNHTNFKNETFFEILCKKGNLKMLEKTFEIYTIEEIESMSITNSLFLAIESHQTVVVEFLLKKHSNKEIFDSKFFKDQYIITDISGRNGILSQLNKTEDITIGNKPISIKLENNVAEENPNTLKNTEEKYKTTEYNYNILDWAIKCNDEESAKLIVEYADLNELENILKFAEKNDSDKMPLTFWKLISKMPRIAEMCLDRFLDLKPEKIEYDMNFTLLDRRCLLKKYPDLRTKISSDNTLGIMIKNDCEHLLEHPMVKIYMNLRWNKWSNFFYYSGLVIHFFYVFVLTGFLVDVRDKKKALLRTEILIFLMSVIFLLIELFQLCKFRTKYLSFENLIQIISFGASAASAVPTLDLELRLQIGSIAILFSYFALGLYSKRVHKLGIYSTALMQVTLTIIKFLFTISIYLIGFSVAFYVLFTNSDFDYKQAWIVRIFFLMAGDFSFTDLKTGTDKDIRYFIMVLFLIVLAIAVNNMLVSFAIKDTNEILNRAHLHNIKTQVEFLEMLETSFKSIRRKSIFFDRIKIKLNDDSKDRFEKYLDKIVEPNELIIKNALRNKKYLKN